MLPTRITTLGDMAPMPEAANPAPCQSPSNRVGIPYIRPFGEQAHLLAKPWDAAPSMDSSCAIEMGALFA
jgi:hypothetical protein